MEPDNPGSIWDDAMTKLIADINADSLRHHSELSTIEFINRTTSVDKTITSLLNALDEPRERSPALSTEYRNSGNDWFKRPDPDNVAACFYTKAIYSARNNSLELAYAHANRAAALCRNPNSVDQGYWDCELAIKYNYPKEKLFKLLQRKLTLAYASNRSDRIAKTLKQLRELVDTEKQFVAKDFDLNYEKSKFEEFTLKQKESKAVEANEKVENAAGKKLIEKYQAEHGRYIVAGESIKTDEAIHRERAFAFVPVYSDFRKRALSRHCQNCAKTNCIPFPCVDCGRASYCSPLCRIEHEPIHAFECVGYQKNLWIKIGIAQLAIRNLLVGFPSLLSKIEHLQSSSPSMLWDDVMSINDPDFAYGDVLALVTNFDKMNKTDRLRYALTAKLLTIYLTEYTTFFEQFNATAYEKVLRSKADWQLFVAGLLFRHLGQLVCNGHAISDIEVEQPSDMWDIYTKPGESILQNYLYQCVSSARIFTAIFPKISILNHSCDPNIRNTFDGDVLTIHATRPIADGEQIYNCYGPHYKLLDRNERRSALAAQYCFDCDCPKCTSDDKTIEQYYEYVCPTNGCGAAIQFDETVKRQWWHDIDDQNVCNAIASKFVCGKCNQQLLLNPSSLAVFFGQSLQQDEHGGRSLTDTEDLMNYYFTVSKCLGKMHELKCWMAQQICNVKIYDDEHFERFAYIILGWFFTTRERYGICSMEFVMATALALKIIRILQENDDKTVDRSEKEKLLKHFNVKQMAKAWSILPKSSQSYFKNCLIQL